MINFAVINLKSTIKNFVKIIIVLLFIIGIVNIGDLLKGASVRFNFVDLVKTSINLKFEKSVPQNSLKKIMISEMPILATGNDLSENDTNVTQPVVTDIVENETQNSEPIEEAKANENLRNLATQVVSENNISENYNTIYENVRIKNETSFELTNDILAADIEYINKKDIIIFHTHTCESYTATDANQYVPSRKL